MRTIFKLSRFSALAVLLASLVLSGCADVAKSAPSPSLQQLIEAAHTRADHEPLVVYYCGEAVAAHAKVAGHHDMIKAFQRQVANGHFNVNMETHCNSLITC